MRRVIYILSCDTFGPGNGSPSATDVVVNVLLLVVVIRLSIP